MFLNGTDKDTAKNVVKVLSQMATKHEKQGFRAFVYFLNGTPKQLKELNKQLKSDNIALALLDPNAEDDSLALYKINKKAKSTIFVYHRRIIDAKWVNYNPKKDEGALRKAITKVSNK